MSIHRFKLPKRHDGTYPPNPWRYACDYGHFHPSRALAVACHRRMEAEADRRIAAHNAGGET